MHDYDNSQATKDLAPIQPLPAVKPPVRSYFSFRSWLEEPERNKLTPEHKTLYVATPPTITSNVRFMNGWQLPTVATANEREGGLSQPSTDTCLEYLNVFYHGLPIKFLPQRLRFVP
ncbi:hypothetical protein F5B22DRAFT_645253 [Xylaria bambusicola]|uniref:uncharacterized protein n=1 Tax=Xylaria bambusicola TaxID=326684 RepID=UPI0020081752|nr:uncharacterized protein F5B22DRAFT_645253 [Xylaria bambusicola]KAI0518006.1 hypothetical protein F5B22DRAFT_645253 [Xylaria bambusicola]